MAGSCRCPHTQRETPWNENCHCPGFVQRIRHGSGSGRAPRRGVASRLSRRRDRSRAHGRRRRRHGRGPRRRNRGTARRAPLRPPRLCDDQDTPFNAETPRTQRFAEKRGPVIASPFPSFAFLATFAVSVLVLTTTSFQPQSTRRNAKNYEPRSSIHGEQRGAQRSAAVTTIDFFLCVFAPWREARSCFTQ